MDNYINGQEGQRGFVNSLVLVIVVAAIFIGVYLVSQSTSPKPKAADEPVQTGATLSLAPASTTFNKGCDFSLDINLDTGGHSTDGTDVILKYDPSLVNVLSIDKGTIYPNYPGSTYDNDSGKVLISGVSSVSTPVTGSGKFATLHLKVSPEATVSATNINFDFDSEDPYKTTDTNVVERGTVNDVLRKVVNGTVNIGNGSSCSSTVSTPPTINAELIPADLGYKAKVNWDNIQNPSFFDRIVLISSSGTIRINNWVYTNSCSKTILLDVEPQSNGSCEILLPNKTDSYQFKLYLDSASSNSLDIVKMPKR